MRFNPSSIFIKIDSDSSCYFAQSAERDYSRLVANGLTRVEIAIKLDLYYFEPSLGVR